MPAVKEPPGLSRDDGKRPDGVTLLLYVYSCALACKNSCCMSPVISSFLREAVDILFSFLSHSCAVILCFRSDVAFREMLLRFC